MKRTIGSHSQVLDVNIEDTAGEIDVIGCDATLFLPRGKWGLCGAAFRSMLTRAIPDDVMLHHSKDAMLDLLHVNCEGCEWEMMELLLSGGFAAKIKVIQWGSHWFDGVKDVEARYCKITEGLAKTHRAEFQQPFGWERWILTQNSPPAWQAPAETQCSHYFSLNPNRFSCCLP